MPYFTVTITTKLRSINFTSILPTVTFDATSAAVVSASRHGRRCFPSGNAGHGEISEHTVRLSFSGLYVAHK